MVQYYADSAKKSLWVLTGYENHPRLLDELTCFAAEKDSGFHIGQRVNNPKLGNSHWQPLEGEILISDILYV